MHPRKRTESDREKREKTKGKIMKLEKKEKKGKMKLKGEREIQRTNFLLKKWRNERTIIPQVFEGFAKKGSSIKALERFLHKKKSSAVFNYILLV